MPFANVFYGWWIVLACFAISFYMGSVLFWGFTAFFTPLVKEFGWSYTQISFASSLRGLEMGILSPLMGILVDRFSPRKIILIGVVAVALGLFSLSYAQNLTMFYLSIISMGLGSAGCTSVVLMTAVSKWFRRRLGLALGIMASGFGASGLGTSVIVWLIDTYGWRGAVTIEAVGILLICLPLAMIVRDDPGRYGLEVDGVKRKPVDNLSCQPAPEVSLSLRSAWRSRPYISLLLIETIRFAAVSAVGLHVMPYLESLGVARSVAGVVASAVPVCSILGRVGYGYLGDRIDKRKAFAFSLTGMTLGLLVFAHVGETWTLVLFLALFSPGLGGGMVLRGAVIRETFGPAAFGSLLGTVMGGSALGGMLGSTLAGWSYDQFGRYYEIWFFLALITAAATLLTRGIKPVSARETSETEAV